VIDKLGCPFEFILGKTKNNFLPLHPNFKEILLHPCIRKILFKNYIYYHNKEKKKKNNENTYRKKLCSKK
jgi:hypothetical protein